MPGERKHRVPPVLLERARAMRGEPAPAEQKLWACLRARQLDGLKFKRQHPVGPFVADFYCAEYRLVLEADGASHAEREAYDAARTRWLRDNGYRVIRYDNADVFDHLDVVLEDILKQVGALPPLPQGGEGVKRKQANDGLRHDVDRRLAFSPSP